MQVRYKMTRADTRSALKGAWSLSARFRVLVLLVAAWPVLLFVALRFATSGSVSVGDILAAAVLGLVFALLVPLMMLVRTKKDERVLSIDPDGIKTTVGQLQGEIRWAKVAAIETTSREVLIVGTSANFFAIPLRAFADAGPQAFVQAAQEYWMAARNETAA